MVRFARVRVREASHPGPASKQRRTQRLRALRRSWDSDGESSSEEQPLVRSACVPPYVLSAWRRSPSLTVAPGNPKAPGRVRDVAEVVDDRDLPLVAAIQVEATVLDSPVQTRQGRRSQRSIPSTQLDASWEHPGPTLELDLTRSDSSDDELLNPAGHVMPCLADREEISSTVVCHDLGQEEFTPVTEGRRSPQKAVPSTSAIGQSNRYAPWMDDGSRKGHRRLVLINSGGTSMPDQTPQEMESIGESGGEEKTHAEVEDRTSVCSEDVVGEGDEVEVMHDLLLVPQQRTMSPDPSSGHENSSNVHERSVPGCSESWSGRDQKGPVNVKRRGVDQRMETLSVAAADVVDPTTQRRPHSTTQVGGTLGTIQQWESVTLVESSSATARKRRRSKNDMERSTAKVFQLTQVGELSTARHVLESSAVAPLAMRPPRKF